MPSLPVLSVVLESLLAGVWIQEQITVKSRPLEVEHLADGVGDAVKGALPNALPAEPVVFHEADYRSLIGNTVVDKVLLRPRRDYEQWLSRTVSTPPKSVWIRRRIEARQRRLTRTARTGAGKKISRTGRLVHDRSHLVVVPSVGVIVQDHDRRALPGRQPLQQVNRLNQEGLLVQWIGVAGVTVLIARCFEEAYGRQISAHRRRV